MSEHILIGLGSIIVLGVLAQWLAWRLHLPAILLLLVFGFIAGPGTGILDPDAVFGNLFYPLVSISVAIILFEGGLSLKLQELRLGGNVVMRLTTLGILITWILAALAGHFVAGLHWYVAVLLGAVLVVTGPTVIIPLLRQIRPTGKIGSIMKWEGIVNDPIGAILAVLVYEAVVAGEASISSVLASGVLNSLLLGSLIGLAGAGLVVLVTRRYMVPDFLQNPVATMLVVMVFLASNTIQSESGLLAVTVMGVALANQRFVSIRHIYEFKENLRVILIASLFIMLAARLPISGLQLGNFSEWAFIALLILVVRPVAVFGSTIGASLTLQERLILAWMAPRGIVAAAVVSVFALQLAGAEIAGVDRMVPLIFKVIFATVAVYGLTVPYLARRLKVAKPNPQGVLFGGAQLWAQEVAKALKNEGFEAAMVDSNWWNVSRARNDGLNAHYGSLLSEEVFSRVPIDELGRFIAATPNDEVNALAAIHFSEVFGRSGVFQLPPESPKKQEARPGTMPGHLHGRHAFDQRATHHYLNDRFQRGAVVKRTTITDEFSMDQFQIMYGEDAIPLFLITSDIELRVFTVKDPPVPKVGDKLISLVQPGERETQRKQTDQKRGSGAPTAADALRTQDKRSRKAEEN